MTCEEKNTHSKNPLFCAKCKAFKPIELYPSVFGGKISKEDLEVLNLRREKERQVVISKDSKNDEECWFVISSEWLHDWKMFVNNK